MNEKLSLYNPRDTPPEQLEAMLTGREHLLKEIFDSLREQAGAPTRQHWLLRGPRGIGKTHLTGIIHHRVSTDAELSKAYLPLWLGEADVYEVYSPATLLMRIAERLVEAVPDASIAEALRTLESTDDEDALFEEVAAHLTEEAERQCRVLLVLMENLDALFESFAPKQRTAQTRQLRALLLGNPRFLFISTTPTRYLKELSDPKAPLFAHLKERKLSPLDVEQVYLLFSKLTQITGRKELLGQGSDAALKQRIIHQLTGGLPRSVVMAFEVLRDKEGIQPLVEDLRVFLDAQTAYFEARLSKLAPRERAIVTTLALADQNLTLKEISEKSLLPEKSLSTLASRLEQEGHIEAVDGSGGKGTLYSLSEGLFRIWYQYRKGRLLLEPLVRFLAYWYEPEELQGVVNTMRQRRAGGGVSIGRAAQLALLQVEAALQIATSEQGRLERKRLWDACRQAVQVSTVSPPPGPLAPALAQSLHEGIALLTSGKIAEGQNLLDQALAPFKPFEQNFVDAVVAFILQKTVSFDEEKEAVTGNHTILQWILSTFSSNPHESGKGQINAVRLFLVDLLKQLGKLNEAVDMANELLAHYKDTADWSDLVFQGAITSRASLMYDLRRYDEAIQDFKQIAEYSHIESSPNAQDLFILSLAALGDIYRKTGRLDEEKSILNKITQTRINNPTKTVKEVLASAKLKLILRQARENKSATETHKLLTAWFEEQQELIPSLPTEKVDIAKALYAAYDAEIHERLPTADQLRPILQIGITRMPSALASMLLSNPIVFFQVFQPKELRGWFERLLQADVPEKLKLQLGFYRWVAETFDGAIDETPEARALLRQKLRRVPSELQELFKVMLARIRRTT